MTVGLAVLFVERRGKPIEALTGDRPWGHRYSQLVGLAAITQIGGAKQKFWEKLCDVGS